MSASHRGTPARAPTATGRGRAADAGAPTGANAGADAGADNACTRCGACCAGMRVDFNRAELQSEGGSVPDSMAVPVVVGLVRLRGTDHARPRCAALSGTVGERVLCGIHEWRPNPCRDFGVRAPFGFGDDACDRARARHGMPPLPR